MANTITLSRLLFLAVSVALLYRPGARPKLIAFGLIVLLIALDGVDGYVARARGETSDLGSVMDIAIDRVVENVLWIVYADITLVPVWVALVVVSRGIITDAIRSYALAKGETAFEMMKTPWARWLVSGRPMRAFYGFMKAFVFAALALSLALREAMPTAAWLQPLRLALLLLVFVTVAITLIRGAPVVYESRRYFFGEPVGS
ncbi:MAG: CDP-alcohol phosphatidyltransferase family protein [Ardenticatenaceae bacterium]|nr:CDP-alcohol phosphatidyltransferase family protein [Ardenticatenaceae bacterium]HBY96705.1 CDP-alcohol phosphatidyltransferase family protein [Chloroflexota bacterium]